MSSAPAGIDVREYAYSYFSQIFGDNTPHVISSKNRWMVTKIQAWAGGDTPNGGLLLGAGGGGTGGPPEILLFPNGCVTLEPNGAFRGDITFSACGTDLVPGLIIIEFWWQSTANVSYPLITVT